MHLDERDPAGLRGALDGGLRGQRRLEQHGGGALFGAAFHQLGGIFGAGGGDPEHEIPGGDGSAGFGDDDVGDGRGVVGHLERVEQRRPHPVDHAAHRHHGLILAEKPLDGSVGSEG
ncbi:hypothetical protein Amsp01_008760 [Amycolatopsis sp. NBRC 101858]|nr:hypothetical protein Amsp01_008760 [Amycolatopsis sp. NBRC 101858]